MAQFAERLRALAQQTRWTVTVDHNDDATADESDVEIVAAALSVKGAVA